MFTTIDKDELYFRTGAMVIYLAIVGVLAYAVQIHLWGYTTQHPSAAVGVPTPDKGLVYPPSLSTFPAYGPFSHPVFNEAAVLVSPELVPAVVALTAVLYTEARGESVVGIRSVADVVRNRVRSDMFPNTYMEVVTQNKQFSGITTIKHIENNIPRNIRDKELQKLVKIAARTVTGEMSRMTYDALFYHTTAINPYWAKHYDKLAVVGNHIFYTTTKL